MSYNNEVDTKEIINALLPSKKIALPKVINKEIKFYYITETNYEKTHNCWKLENEQNRCGSNRAYQRA